jgi:serine protease Do
VKVELGLRPSSDEQIAARSSPESSQRFGVRLETLTEELAQHIGVEADSGAVVVEVDPDGAARRAGLVPGDVIVSVDGQRVSSAGQCEELLGGKSDDARGARLLVHGRGGSRFVLLPRERQG